MKQLCLTVLSAIALGTIATCARAQSCQTRDEIPRTVRTALESSAQQAFEQASLGNAEMMRANSVPSLMAGFDGIAGAVKDNHAARAGSRAQIRAVFLLDTGAKPSPEGRFFCGLGAKGLAENGAEFVLPGLPVGKYGIVIQDVVGQKGPYALTSIFQDISGWKLAGFYVRPKTANGHDGFWYLERAREYKSKGQVHNAWIYYATSWDLSAPVTFMETKILSEINSEANAIRPKDIPVGGGPVKFSANGKTYDITDVSVFRSEKTFDLSIKYSVASTADFSATIADARNLANAYIARYPELIDAFDNVWAHAIDSKGGAVPSFVNLKRPKKP
jgi:hypothetical protein